MSAAHQLTAVSIEGRALLIEGPPGIGKSSLALTLIDRGASLIGDDGVMLERRGAGLLAHPHPETCGLIEVRNLGVLPFPCVGEVPVALLVRLDETAPRFIESAEDAELCGVALPRVRLWPSSHALAIRAELALQFYGIAPD